MLNSKQIDSKWLEPSNSISTKVADWIYDNNPIPYSVRFWFHDKDIFHPRRVYRKCANIVRWVPILWRDTDWDYSGLYEIIEYKIRNMRTHQLEHANHTDANEVAEQMKTAADCLKRLRDDNYIEEEWNNHRKKHPDRPLIDLPDGMKQIPPMSAAERGDFKKLVDAEEKRKQDDYETFTSIFTKHSRGWWD